MSILFVAFITLNLNLVQIFSLNFDNFIEILFFILIVSVRALNADSLPTQYCERILL